MVGALGIAEQMTLGRGTLVLIAKPCSAVSADWPDQRMIADCHESFTRMNVKVR
jgi:hypothetical protein